MQNGVTKHSGRGGRKVIEDDSDEEPLPEKPQPKKPNAQQRVRQSPPPAGEATTTSDYFSTTGTNKPKRSGTATRGAPSATKGRATLAEAAHSKSTAKSNSPNPSTSHTPTSRASNRTRTATSYVEQDSGDDEAFMDIDAEDVTKSRKVIKASGDFGNGNSLTSNSRPRRISNVSTRQENVREHENDVNLDVEVDVKNTLPENDLSGPDADGRTMTDKPALTNKQTSTGKRKRQSIELFDDDHAGATPVKGQGKKAKSKAATPAKKRAKNDGAPESAEMQAIFDSIPTVRPPTPPEPSGEPKKFDFRSHQANRGSESAAGSSEMPVGAENCLAGLSFVFTGLLEKWTREEGQALVKRYGGKVMSAPSSKTSYVVLGTDAGPKKLETIRDHKIKTINEDGLSELVRRLPANGGDSTAAVKNEEKKRAQEDVIKKQVAEMEKEDMKVDGTAGAGKGKLGANAKAMNDRLWTVKYAPTQLSQIVGNKTQVEKLQRWLRNFPKNQRTGFKMAGADGSGAYRAVIIHGPPGIGKTTAAHLVAKLEGYDVVESNASDTRSKKLVETGLKGVLSTRSLLGYFAGTGQQVEAGKKKLVLIMDEVDGMSAGDRGGVGALAAVCKKTQVPIILICNDRKLQKMKPFDFCTYDLPFRRPTTDQIRSRIMTIVYREELKLPGPVVEALIEGTGADIRQVVNMLSTAKLDQEAMDFDKGKSMSKAWEKHIILRPWDIVGKILGGGMFASSSKATLNDKIELYFNDHDFSYLMLQENYLGTNPIAANMYSGKERNLKLLELSDRAAESISDGDLVDRMIHGSQQQWSLMPSHAVFSFVRPASFVAGSMAGHKSNFTQWLGKNSTQGKLTRAVKEIQGHMRLRTSADRHEIRQQYIPLLWFELIKKLELKGKELVPAVIDLLDSYFLTRDDWDAIMELGVGPMDMGGVKLETQTKATFTRLYNQQSHPLPFMKASNVVAPKKQTRDKPDLEEALEESDEGEVVEEVKVEDDEEVDLSKDKYVKQAKKKPAARAAPQKSSGKATRNGKNEVQDNASDVSDEDDAKPKKGRGRAKVKAPAKPKGKK